MCREETEKKGDEDVSVGVTEAWVPGQVGPGWLWTLANCLTVSSFVLNLRR